MHYFLYKHKFDDWNIELLNKTYSSPAEWYTLKNPVRPSRTRGTLMRICIEVAFTNSYVKGGGEDSSEGNGGPKMWEKNIDQVDSTLAFKLYIHKSVFEQVQYSDHHTYIPIQDNMACRLLVFW